MFGGGADGVKRCIEQINRATRGQLSDEELKERQARAMQDPEVQAILSDPVMRQVLNDFSTDPKAAAVRARARRAASGARVCFLCVSRVVAWRASPGALAERDDHEETKQAHSVGYCTDEVVQLNRVNARATPSATFRAVRLQTTSSLLFCRLQAAP